MLDETQPKLYRDQYKRRRKAVAKRILYRLADHESGVVEYDESEIRPLISETESIHQHLPHSIINYGHHDPNPGAWEYINNAPPLEGLRRQALDVLSQDVAKQLEEFIESGDYIYRDDEQIHLRESFIEEVDLSSEGEGRTHLLVTTAIDDAPEEESPEADEIKNAATEAIEGALYEVGHVGHDTNATWEKHQ